jgi:hypothetical protein
MALSPVVDTLDQVPEPLRALYVSKDGKYVLDLSGPPVGFVPAADLALANGKVVEFRDNNIKLMKEVEELRPLKTTLAKFDGIDPDAARAAITKTAALQNAGVQKPDDIAAMIKVAVDAANKPLADQLAASHAATLAAQKRADDATLRETVVARFVKAGGKAKASDFTIAKALEVFDVKDGKVVAKADRFSAEKPGNPLDVDEWMQQHAREHDFAFEPSKGGGANPAPGGTGGSVGRPGQTILKDPTPQQLGENAAAIGKGTVRVEYTNQQP